MNMKKIYIPNTYCLNQSPIYNGVTITYNNIKIINYCNHRIWYIKSKELNPFIITENNYILHRTDGPAVEFSNTISSKWYWYGQFINCKNQRDFDRIVKLKCFW